MQITFFDFLILLAMFGGALLGFFRGLFRQALVTLAIYIATVLSTLGYRGVSRLISRQPTSGTHILSFIILMIVSVAVLVVISRELLGDIDVDRMKIWVNIGGMVFGFINSAVVCAVLLIVIRSATGGPEWFGYQGVQRFFQNQTTNSWMSHAFRPFMRFLVAIIRPWLFGNTLPPLLLSAM